VSVRLKVGPMNQISSQCVAVPKRRFWARQFAADSTTSQDAFDVICAVVLPIFVLVADPVVFRVRAFGVAILGDFQLVAYVVAAISMGVFLAWRTFQTRVSRFGAAFAAVFFLSAICAGVIGLAILPYSLIGLMVLIGLLGFTPFFTAFVFLRNGVRAARFGQSASSFRRWLAMMAAGVLVVILPVVVSVRIDTAIASSVHTIIVGDLVDARDAANRLERYPFVPDKYRHQLVEAYWREVNPFKRAMLKRICEDITGDEIRDWSPMPID